MVLHWLGEPGPSGLPGSIPGAGVYFITISIDFYVHNYKKYLNYVDV